MIARLMLAVMLCGLLPAARLTASEPHTAADVTVRNNSGVYSVTARFAVPQPPSVALSVLTDYERIPRFMPRVKTSVVRERTPDGAIVEQEAVSRLMLFSKRLHLMLEIVEGSDTLRFRDRCGKSFTRYEGRWQVSARHRETEITYELVAQPSFDVPAFILTRLLKRDSAEMIAQLQREIAARAQVVGRTPEQMGQRPLELAGRHGKRQPSRVPNRA